MATTNMKMLYSSRSNVFHMSSLKTSTTTFHTTSIVPTHLGYLHHCHPPPMRMGRHYYHVVAAIRLRTLTIQTIQPLLHCHNSSKISFTTSSYLNSYYHRIVKGSTGNSLRTFSTARTTSWWRSSVRTSTIAASTMVAAMTALMVSYCCMTTKSNITTTLLEAPHLLVTDHKGETPMEDDASTTTTILNWSGTHAVQVPNDHYWEPETIAEVEAIVQACHERGQSVRPIGSALSPNGIGFCSDGMISLIQLDQIVHIDPQESTVTVQAGARVSQVVEALRPYQLTLPNLASIAEQQMGGFIQVGAHGTGKAIAPVDHYVTQLKLVTPARGTITLTEKDGDLFHMAKVGLGCLGVVVEVTMKCIPAHQLKEHTFVLTRKEAKEQLDTLLQNHKHMRYMWIPYTDTVVCVTNDPVETDNNATTASSVESLQSSVSKSSNFWFRTEKSATNVPTETTPKPFQNTLSMEERLQPLVDLLLHVSEEVSTTSPIYTNETVQGMGFGALRDAILAMKDPLDVTHVQRCNNAEAEFWKRNEDYIIKPSDELLQFDCGGQQWVWEVCFPTGTQECNNGNDIRFMEQLLEGIESKNIPAHAPIEQRWSASSSSYMSPAYGPSDGLHSWVGIINYLPPIGGTSATPEQEMLQRQKITALFTGPYCDLMHNVGTEVNATSHWAKLEPPKSLWDLIDLQLFLNTRFPLDKFNAWRGRLDPKNILASPVLTILLGKPKPSE